MTPAAVRGMPGRRGRDTPVAATAAPSRSTSIPDRHRRKPGWVALRVHALDVADVITDVAGVARIVRGLRAGQSRRPGARWPAPTAAPFLTRHRRAGAAPHHGADHGTAHPRCRWRAAGRNAANAFQGHSSCTPCLQRGTGQSSCWNWGNTITRAVGMVVQAATSTGKTNMPLSGETHPIFLLQARQAAWAGTALPPPGACPHRVITCGSAQ